MRAEIENDNSLTSTQHQKIADKFSEVDVVEQILADHQPIKKLLVDLQRQNADVSDLQIAFESLVPLLLSHATAEEKTVYRWLKNSKDLEVLGHGGQIEHHLAGQMVNEIKNCSHLIPYRAKCKVLAELVEHHIKEEEEKILPQFRKKTSSNERMEICKEYLKLRRQNLMDQDADFH